MQTELFDLDLVALCERRSIGIRPTLAIIALLNNRVEEAGKLLCGVSEKPDMDPETHQILAALYVATKYPKKLGKTEILHRAGVTSSELFRLERGLPVQNRERCIARLRQALLDNGVTIAAPVDSADKPADSKPKAKPSTPKGDPA